MARGSGPAEQLAIESRRTRVAELYTQGVRSQHDLAERVGVNRSTVSRDLKVIRRTWQADMVRDFADAMAEELAANNLIMRTAWEAWSKSGDPRFLDQIQKCHDRRCKILGLFPQPGVDVLAIIQQREAESRGKPIDVAPAVPKETIADMLAYMEQAGFFQVTEAGRVALLGGLASGDGDEENQDDKAIDQPAHKSIDLM